LSANCFLSEEHAVNFSFAKRETVILVLVLAVSLLVRVLLFPLRGFPTDTGDFIAWFNRAVGVGIRPFYAPGFFADYPPFNVYIFWAFGSLANAIHLSMATMVKVVPNLFDLATAALIYFFARKQASFKIALLATALYAFNPAVIFNAAVWGQYDAVYTFFLVLSLMLALKSKPELSAISFALGILTKPQGIALAPLLILLIFKKDGLKRLLTSVLAFAASFLVVVLPFEGISVSFLTNIYSSGYSYYNYGSVNAFNLWGLLGLTWVHDGALYIVGWVLFGAFAAFTLYVVHRRFRVSGDYLAVFAAFMLLFCFFMLPTRIHERYMFPAISMLALMFPLLKKTRLMYVTLTVTLFLNEFVVLNWLNNGYPSDFPYDPVILAVSAINLLMLVYASILMWYELKGRGWLSNQAATLNQTPQSGEPK
jgi:dolichyl-phosphate-mannose-protein mannosyltransferase